MRPRALLVMSALVVMSVPTAPASAQAAQRVVISEIHYHPQPVGVAFPDFNDRENTEFVELLNLESTAVDLSGWCLDRAVDFCFPAGTSLGPSATFVIADDSAAFTAVYGFAPGAVYAGQLSNGGEQIRLVTNTGAVAVDVTWQTAHPWPVLPDGQGPSLELRATGGTLSSPAQWEASTPVGGTPGVAPTLGGAALPLVLSHTAPALVSAGTPVQVVASAINTTGMTLQYNVNYGANQSITMTQGGADWQATLPALATGAMVRYRFLASGPGGTTSSPRADDVIDWWAVAVASPQPHNVPVLDLYFTPTAWADIDANRCGCTGTVAYEGRIWTDVVVRRAGSTSLNAPKANLRLDFPAGHPFVASFLDGPADELTLDGGHTNTDLIREKLSWDLMSGIGFPPIRSTHVRTMRSGTFQGLYLLREEQDGNWRARHNLDRGLLYKVEGTTDTFGFSGEHEKKEGFDEPDTDMFTLRTCLDQTGAAFRSCALAQIDVPQLVNEIAATALIRNIDQREFNFLIYRDNTQNRLWRFIPDDLDRTWGIDGSGSQLGSPTVSSLKPYNRCIGADTTPANEMCRALMRWPEFEAMYNRRLRTLVDEVLADPIWSTKIASMASLIGLDWDDDEATWNRTSFDFPTIVGALDGWVDDYVAHQRAGGHDGKVPAAQSSAPVVTITGYRSDPGDGLGYVSITNPSASESVDLSNWQFVGLAEIPVGLVVLPGATVVVSTSDQLFRAANPTFGGMRTEVDATLAGPLTLVRRDGSIAATVGDVLPAPLVLNEWNAVSSAKTLLGGDLTFGTIVGNGGDWFELVVIDDVLDVRGWRLVLSDADGVSQAVRDQLVFADEPLLAELEGGTIITISESFADDVSFNPAAGDWHINLQSNDADAGAYFTPASQSNFSTNHHDWRLSIFDATGRLVFGPAGEGIGATTGISSTEAAKLMVDPSASVNPLTDYKDSDTSSFGRENVTDARSQDLTALRFAYVLGDVTCDGVSNVIDALRIAQFSVGVLNPERRCPLGAPATSLYSAAGDANADGSVTVVDALLVAQCSAGVPNVLCPP